MLPFLLALSCSSSDTPLPPPSEIAVLSHGVPDRRRARRSGRGHRGQAKSGAFIVKLRADAEAEELVALSDARISRARRMHPKARRRAKKRGMQRAFRIDSTLSERELRAALSRRDDVAWVEPVVTFSLLGEPSDTNYGHQWNLHALKLPEVLQRETGRGVTVAVIDSGVSEGPDGFDHLERGYDFVDDDGDASDAAAEREDGWSGSHGTHVAGTIAQATDNHRGVAGLAPGVDLLPVRVMGQTGTTSELLAEAIVWAVDEGADVINLSLGGYLYAQVVADALDYAYEEEVTVVVASGNDGFSDTIAFPASYPTTIAVGASDAKGEVAWYSNGGPYLDLVAPGGDTEQDADGDGYADGILQETVTRGSWSYALYQGTSMAAPHVAAAAALVIAGGIEHPDEVRNALLSTARDVGSRGRDDAAGYGALDVLAAVSYREGQADIPWKGEEGSPVGVGPGEGRGEGRDGGRDGAGRGGGERGRDGAGGGKGGQRGKVTRSGGSPSPGERKRGRGGRR